MDRPVLPAPHQIAEDLYQTVFKTPVDSKRSLVYHAGVTVSATVLGFLFGSLLGIVLAVGIVHLTVLDRSLLPWVIASQTVPILAIAPMVVVVLGNLGLSGLLPKAIISMYLCFFPVTIGMVKGLRSPDPLQLDLMRTYSATPAQVFWKLRWPAATGFLFTSLKVAIAVEPGRRHRRRAAHGRAGRDRRTSAERLVLRADHPDLVGADRGVAGRGGAGGLDRRHRAAGPARPGSASMKSRPADLFAMALMVGGLVAPAGSDGWAGQLGAIACAVSALLAAALLLRRWLRLGRTRAGGARDSPRRGRSTDPARRARGRSDRRRPDSGCSSPDGRCSSGSG